MREREREVGVVKPSGCWSFKQQSRLIDVRDQMSVGLHSREDGEKRKSLFFFFSPAVYKLLVAILSTTITTSHYTCFSLYHS